MSRGLLLDPQEAGVAVGHSRGGRERFGNPGRMFGLDIVTGRSKPGDPNTTYVTPAFTRPSSI